MAGALVDDTSHWPLVIVEWPTGIAGPEMMDEVLQRLTKLYGRRHAVLHDGIRVGGMDARPRQRAAQHVEKYADEIKKWVVASAAVAPSMITRGIITAIQWVAPSPSPFKAFADRSEAEEWLLQALRRAGVVKPVGTGKPASPQ
jgi:hypothetical protein